MIKTTVRFKYSFFFVLFFAAIAAAEPLQFDADSLYEHGKRLREENRFESALTQWEKVLEKNPHHLKTLTALTELHYFLGHFEKTLACGTEAIRLDPDNADLYLQVGMTLAHVGRSEEGVHLLKKGAELSPHRVDLLLELAQLELALENYESSRHFSEAVLAREPRNPEAAQQLGLAWGAQQNKKEARKWLEQAFAWDPNFAPALFSVALLDIEEEAFVLAEQRLEKVVDLTHVHPRAFFYLALLAQKKNRLFAEYRWLKRATPYFPKESDEWIQIEKRRSEIETAFALSQKQMETYSQYDLLIELEDSKEKVIEKLGPPSYQKGDLFLYSKPPLAVLFDGGKAIKIEMEKEFQGKVHGFKMGDSLQDVVAILGEPASSPQGIAAYKIKNQVVTFGLNQDKINKIILTVEL